MGWEEIVINSLNENIYLIIRYSIPCILVGYLSMLFLCLEKKEGKFSNFSSFEKSLFSIPIGGCALIFVAATYVSMRSINIIFTQRQKAIEALNTYLDTPETLFTKITLAFFASILSAIILNRLIKENITLETIVNYVKITLLSANIFILVALEPFIWYLDYPLRMKVVPMMLFGISILIMSDSVLRSLDIKSYIDGIETTKNKLLKYFKYVVKFNRDKLLEFLANKKEIRI